MIYSSEDLRKKSSSSVQNHRSWALGIRNIISLAGNVVCHLLAKHYTNMHIKAAGSNNRHLSVSVGQSLGVNDSHTNRASTVQHWEAHRAWFSTALHLGQSYTILSHQNGSIYTLFALPLHRLNWLPKLQGSDKSDPSSQLEIYRWWI